MTFLHYCESPIGMLGLAEENGALTHLFFRLTEGTPHFKAAELKATPLLRKAAGQLAEYFSGKRRDFDLPLAPAGTAFQRQVWDALQAIPYGGTRSYREVAESVKRPAAYRAVGMANNKNPIAVIIPCHRVIGANGSLTGYAGGLNAKRLLLVLEGAVAG